VSVGFHFNRTAGEAGKTFRRVAGTWPLRRSRGDAAGVFVARTIPRAWGEQDRPNLSLTRFLPYASHPRARGESRSHTLTRRLVNAPSSRAWGERTDRLGEPIGDLKPLTNGKKSKGGNMTDYLTARIKEVRPDILERMKAGEFPSVRAAARPILARVGRTFSSRAKFEAFMSHPRVRGGERCTSVRLSASPGEANKRLSKCNLRCQDSAPRGHTRAYTW